MTRLDANGAAWFHLGTEHEFLPWPGAPGPDPLGPLLGEGVSYDADRHVLELLAEAPRHRRQPLAGLADDPSGERYLVAGGRLWVQRCDGSREPFPCEPAVLRDPRGLALDDRGRLYVADRAARRVVVLEPQDGRVEARLEVGGLREPVDVLVAPSGEVYVADRGGRDLLGLGAGRIWRFSARLAALGSWVPQDGGTPPRPLRPRPVAVLWDGGDVLVADEAHPRLLAFSPEGEPRPERDYAALASSYRAHPAGRVAAHAADRVLRLTAGGRFRTAGTWTSAVLDAGVPGAAWHRVDVGADLPPGTSAGVETATAETRDALASPAAWDVLLDRDGAPLRFSGSPAPDPPPLAYDAAATASRVREQLVLSPPGRFLRVRVQLRGDGSATPSLHALRVFAPRNSYRLELPAVWSKDPSARGFLDGFLSLFERVFTRIEDDRDAFYRLLSPVAAAPDVLAWLAALLDLTFDPSWPLERRRALVLAAAELYRRRGTPAGIVRYVEVYAGVRPVVTEAFTSRPDRVPATGSGVLGLSTTIGLTPGEAPSDEALIRAFAHRFTVHLVVPDACDRERLGAVVDRIVTVNKPAHTVHRLDVVGADARLGVQSTVGVDLVPGAPDALGVRLDPAPGAPVLGQGTVLGGKRPGLPPPDTAI